MGSIFSEAPKPDSSEKAVWIQWSDSRYVRSYRSNNACKFNNYAHLKHDVTATILWMKKATEEIHATIKFCKNRQTLKFFNYVKRPWKSITCLHLYNLALISTNQSSHCVTSHTTYIRFSHKYTVNKWHLSVKMQPAINQYWLSVTIK